MNPEYAFDGHDESDYTLFLDFDVYKVEGENFFQVPVTLKVRPAKGLAPSTCPVRRLEIMIEGVFRFPEDVEDEVVHTLMPANALAMLYSLSRGVVSGLAAGLPGAHRLLPTVDLTNVLRAKQAQMTKRAQRESLPTR